MTELPPTHLPNVKAQYEAYPFPQRDPRDETKRLHISEYDSLGRINHHLFGGRQDFRRGFRALVAGGGTGDATVYLAAQLQPLGGRVTYIDMSGASLRVAQARAQVRGLDNIEWHNGSLLDLPEMGLAPFDYISCTGVLHHLAEPAAGLKALTRVLAPDGGMGLMLYGRHGRRDIYWMQELVRRALAGETALDARVAGAIALLKSLPRAHPFFRGQDPKAWLETLAEDKPNLFDAFLHEQDRGYSVPELYEFLHAAGLRLIAFTNYQRKTPVYRLQYDPASFVTDAALLARLHTQSAIEQQAIAEIMDGNIGLHTFYASRRQDAAAALGPEMVPYFAFSGLMELTQTAVARKSTALSLELWNGRRLRYRCQPHTLSLLAALDGTRSCAEILAAAGGETPEIRAELARIFSFFHQLDWMLLRHKDVPPFAPLPMYQWR